MPKVLRCLVLDCRGIDDDALGRMASTLSEVRRAYSLSFAQFPDRVMSVVAGSCMESLAESLDTEIVRSPNGKPVFGRDDMHLSVSHSGGLVAVAWSDMPVGVDLQRIVPMGNIADRILSPKERDMMTDRSDRSLVRVWTRKESYVKLTGDGISKRFDTFDDDVIDPGYGFHTVDVTDDVVMSVCGRSDVTFGYDMVIVRSVEDIRGAVQHDHPYERP